MAARPKNTPTFVSPNKRRAILAHASGWCAGRTATLTRSVSEDPTSTLIRSVSEDTASQIDWPIVGVAGVMAGLFVVCSIMMAWVAGRSANSTNCGTRSVIGAEERGFAYAGAKREGVPERACEDCSDESDSTDAGTTQSVGAVRSHAERRNKGLASADHRHTAAVYPEGDSRVIALAPAPTVAVER